MITGARKTLHREKVVCACFASSAEEAAFINNNPMFEAYGIEYVNDVRTIAAHDNMVAINNALAVDLSGQITAETLYGQMHSGPGGQLAFAIGANLAKNGRFITVLPATADGGRVSRIVPRLHEGSVVTVPRTFADYVVTEFGVAKLMGKSLSERQAELISIAHPDFRDELRFAMRGAL